MKKLALSFLLAIGTMMSLFAIESEAITSSCLKTLHKQAISDAINLTPQDLKAILKEVEAAMHKQIDTIHATAPKDRFPFAACYESVLDEIKAGDKRRPEYLSRMITHITIYPFLKYSPIETYESCNEINVLNGATVIYDGFTERSISSKYAEYSHKYENKRAVINLQQFYSLMVNDIADVWTSIWKASGRDISDLPKTGTLVRGKINEEKTVSEKTIEPRGSEQQGSTGIITNSDLGKYRNPSDGKYTGSQNDLPQSDPEQKDWKKNIPGTKGSPEIFNPPKIDYEKKMKEMRESKEGKELENRAYERCLEGNSRAQSYYANCINNARATRGLHGVESVSCGAPHYEKCVKPAP
ncbi:MAG: hypothetical protein HZA15_16765 [Nitrospirae bacterium]|nr:hypothetical protein [Nitrospirota bacterium]